MPKLSAVIITRNEAENIEACLQSLAGLCDEIVMVDDHSTDTTIQRAAPHSPKVFTRALDGFGPQKQFALERANGEWVLSLDADERVTPALREEILRELRAPRADGYEIRREIYYLGRRLRFGGMQSDRVLRLFRRGRGAFTLDAVHERVRVSGPVLRLRAPLEHHTHPTIERHRQKIERYSRLAAEKGFARGQRPRWWTSLRPGGEFLRRYLFRLGFLDGVAGFRYAALSATATALRARHLRRLARQAGEPHGEVKSR